jgi:hypothetical protein
MDEASGIWAGLLRERDIDFLGPYDLFSSHDAVGD